MMKILPICVFSLIGAVNVVFAFNGHHVTEGPLDVFIDPIPVIDQYDKETVVHVRLTNSGIKDLKVNVQLDHLVDEMGLIGRRQNTVLVPSAGNAVSSFVISCAKSTCSALYPVHIYVDFMLNGTEHQAHAVRIVQTDFSQPDRESSNQDIPLTIVPSQGAVSLLSTQSSQVIWKYFDGQEHKMPVGWTGSDKQSGTYVSVHDVQRGQLKPALSIHPPWRPRAGTAYIEYRLKLPDATPLILNFANAIRDNSQQEPASDGVTFRVWVNEAKLYDKHIDAKSWQAAQVDLSPYAGHEIRLRLESHPGPDRNTTCDTSYWAQPMIIAGSLPVITSAQQWDKQRDLAGQLMTKKRVSASNELMISLDDGYKAAIVMGQNGLLDASVAIGKDDKYVIFDGFDMSISKYPLGKTVSAAKVESFHVQKAGMHAVKVNHELLINGQKESLDVLLSAKKGGLKVSFDCSERITDLALGRADQRASRVYYGHGYCIENPKPFQAGFGGHNLSTSHVGFDFNSGISLVTASDNPPDRLVVNPDSNIYALHTHMNATLTLVPSLDGAFEAAKRYRPLYDKQAAPAFEQKAGRFVFDIWGGRYADNARIMQQMIDYGLTDSMLTLHVWQRWGYDYRLPDVYPPNPDLGSVEDLQSLSSLCAEYDIPWGLHDNYIDFYPDAEDYTYEHIAFTEKGEPIKAWLNESREAQSYRWRPDRILPFVKRNLNLISPNLHPTHYFIDVFTSINCFDFYDRQGNFHSSLETRQCWGEAFAWIRNKLGGRAPMTSEAGHDQLTGYIEGADCQFLSLSKESNRFMIRLACDDWERVPWYDAVLHDKFSLHGVGYSGRYQGGRDRQVHGIESDDYISAEILTGHALMIDRGAFGQGAVRKYYLAQDFIRSIADDTIREVQFVDDDIHRQIIRWNSGATVYVNRSEKDWNVAGKKLPQYGYYAKNGQVQSSIEKINDVIVEQSTARKHFFVNARGYGDKNQLDIIPKADHIENLGNNQFKLYIDWKVQRPGPKDARVFLHFVQKDSSDNEDIAFQGDFTPDISIADWTSHVITGDRRAISIPSHVQTGEYEIYVGLWSPKTHQRYRLRGDNDGSSRYLLGQLHIERNQQGVTSLKLIPHQKKELTPGWGNLARIPIDFGCARTSGAFRCEISPGKLKIIPLPDIDPFEIKLNLTQIVGKQVHPSNLRALDRAGHSQDTIQYQYSQNGLTFQTKQTVFAYELTYE